MKKTALIASLFLALPMVAFAAPLQNIMDLINSFATIVQYIIPILVGLAIAWFFWGLVKYIRHPDLKEGKNTMIAGIISLFVMISIWGIVQFFQAALLPSGTNVPNAISAPHFQ